jgi:hypothetical protein
MIKEPIKFLGAYVLDVSVNAGWNGDNSSCSITLVEENDDPERPGKKIDDVRFQPPEIGTCCMLKIKDDDTGNIFKFAGVLQRYTYIEDVSGGRKWEVELNSPSSFLDGVHIVLGSFIGTVYVDDTSILNPSAKPVMPYNSTLQYTFYNTAKGKFENKKWYTPSNVINLYGYKENIGQGGKFGGADLNSLGYPVANFVTDFMDCCKKGIFGGPLIFAGTQYDFDLTDLQTALVQLNDYRIKSDFLDMNSLLKNISEVSMYDYYLYVDEDPDKGYLADNLGVMKKATLKIKMLSRKQPADPDQIKNIIYNFVNVPDEEKNVKSFRIGKELSSDLVTQKVLIGDRATRHWFANQAHMLPIWGKKGTGANAVYYYGTSMKQYTDLFTPVRVVVDALDMTGQKNSFVREGDFLWFDTNLLEIRCALSSRQTWEMYHKMFLAAPAELQQKLNYNTPISILSGFTNMSLKDIRETFKGNKTTHDLMDTSLDSAEIYASYMFGTKDAQKDILQRTMNTRFNGIKTVAEQFYGKEFLVAIPSEPGGVDNNFRWIKFDQKPEYVWETSSSAWAGNYITQYINDPAFYEEGAGRLKAVAAYQAYQYDPVWGGTLADYSALGHDYTIINYLDQYQQLQQGVVGYTNIDTAWGVRYLDVSTMYQDTPNGLVPVDYPVGELMQDSVGNTVLNRIYGFAKVSVPPVEIYDQYTTEVNAFGVLAKLIFRDDSLIGKSTKVGYQNMFGSENIADFGIAPAMLPPTLVSIPQQSTRYVWGPWWAFSGWDSLKNTNADQGRKGKVSIDVNTDLKPEIFGTIEDMNIIAAQIAQAELSVIHASETGYVELVESPKWNIADKIFDVGPYITTIAINISSEEIKTTYNFTTWTKKRGELAMYNYRRLIAGQKEKFRFLQELRNMVRKSSLPPVNKALLTSVQKETINSINRSSANGVFASWNKSLWRAINAVQPQAPAGTVPGEAADSGKPDYGSINAHSSPTQAAMKAVGFSPEESFGASYEQIYSPAYIWNQRQPIAHKILFNKGLFEVRGQDNTDTTGGKFNG